MSAATWGHSAAGLTPTAIVKLEQQALSCAGLAKEGRCRTTGLVVHYGLMGGPMAQIIREVFLNWFQVVGILSNAGYLKHIQTAWHKAKQFVTSKQFPFNHVTGMMTNVIAILQSLGWRAWQLNRWQDPQGHFWHLSLIHI